MRHCSSGSDYLASSKLRVLLFDSLKAKERKEKEDDSKRYERFSPLLLFPRSNETDGRVAGLALAELVPSLSLFLLRMVRVTL